MNLRSLFLAHNGQTSMQPLAIEFVKASCATLFDNNGKAYIDLIGGISVCNVGHSHPKVVKAVQDQAALYMHTMVYGEVVLAPQVQYAAKLASLLPQSLNSVFFTASGTEATEGAMKLAKRYTGKPNIIACNNSYHGSTQGALSVMGSEYWRNAFRPLLPGISHYDYNSFDLINAIDKNTAAVIVEVVQAESGVTPANKEWLMALRAACNQYGALLIFDEIQSAFGRTGKLFAFEHYNVVPDILLLGKALGGGLPLGAFVADRDKMLALADAPVLGHINTFGGNPVCCAAGLAALEALLEEGWMETVATKSEILKAQLQHKKINSTSVFGLWASVNTNDFTTNKNIIDYCIANGVFTDWFLFNANGLRIGPPLLIHEKQIETAISVILNGIEKYA
jgi:acetylornithine/N-succinyldiaminopimelate aminotransferase